MKVNHEVTDINAVKKTVTVHNLDTGKVYEESYDKLILSPGAKPVMPNLPGIENEKIFTLRTVEDTLKIRSFVEEKKPKTAVMVGGGFIGLEVAENLCDLGVKVTVVPVSYTHLDVYKRQQLYFTTEKAWGGKSDRRYQLPAGDVLPTDEGDKADVW